MLTFRCLEVGISIASILKGVTVTWQWAVATDASEMSSATSTPSRHYGLCRGSRCYLVAGGTARPASGGAARRFQGRKG